VLDRVLVDEAIEVHFECRGHCGRSTGARAVDEAPRALVSKAMDPLAQGRIRLCRKFWCVGTVRRVSLCRWSPYAARA
jgi:hypothetical protein